jgi:hypothetical protein
MLTFGFYLEFWKIVFYMCNLYFGFRFDRGFKFAIKKNSSWASCMCQRQETVMQHSLTTAHSIYVAICCYWVDLNIAELGVLWTRVPTCKTGEQNRITIRRRTGQEQNLNAPDKAARWISGPGLSCSYQVSGTRCVHNSYDKENDLEEFC